ncbi:hypothetical protein BDZ94DRAFT_900072 [Collybia nuda]|uniref:DUF6534 domain-containing protein n=1 Tax=Collybia nuda TaxID=64659 RepID=A0A9P6CIK5_9AGAR|nr:hypothetical protein BDZ94DRAFT_900072 [Collybia nuda]
MDMEWYGNQSYSCLPSDEKSAYNPQVPHRVEYNLTILTGTMSLVDPRVAGPLLIGYLLNWGLQGVLCAQVYSYYVAFPKDRTILKFLVYGVLILETLETGVATSDAFATFASGFLDPHSPEKVHLLWLSVPVHSGIVGCIGQLFFASRIKKLSGSWTATCCVAFLAILTSASALASGIQYSQVPTLLVAPRAVVITIQLWLASNVACSVVIASMMTYFLWRQDNKFFPRNQTIFSKLICLFVETGTLSAAVSVIDLALFIGSKGTTYHTVPALFMSKVYSNTMLVVFNNRMSIIGGRGDTDGSDSSILTIARLGSRWRRRKNSINSFKRASPMDAIHVRTEVWTDPINLDRLELTYSNNKELHEISGDGKRPDLSQIGTNDSHVM